MSDEEVRDHSLVPSTRALPAIAALIQRGIALADAIDAEPDLDDPPERIFAWLMTVAPSAVRALDLTLVLDLLCIEESDDRWGKLMTPVVALIEDLLLVGDFNVAAQLVEVLTQNAAAGESPSRRQYAVMAIDMLVAGPMMRNIITHLLTIDDALFERVKAMCVSVGEVLVKPLADAFSTEERARPRQRLTAILLAFGVVGKQSVERPKPTVTPTRQHIRASRDATEQRVEGNLADMAAIKSLFEDAVSDATSIWESAAIEGKPDATMARSMIDGLAQAVAQNRTALLALTTLKIHMVNVSILTMAQARGLGIDGPLLMEFGLAALMHDIGKVRTPMDILNKREKLTDSESAIMKRHTIDGAEILRQTGDIPALAPIVAFEHHLRLDGSGYPNGVKRSRLNLATMLCRIADVYDAMRSRSFPTDRILEVLRCGKRYDRHLVRRFVQLIGIYPAGNLVKLDTGEIAVVLKVYAPDPFRPQVRVLFDRQGKRLALTYDLNLWESGSSDGRPKTIVGPLDPAAYP
jgi:putative nucleotidyltransferase with HDIG domain